MILPSRVECPPSLDAARLRGYLDSAAAHGISALDTIEGKSWLPPLPALAWHQITGPYEWTLRTAPMVCSLHDRFSSSAEDPEAARSPQISSATLVQKPHWLRTRWRFPIALDKVPLNIRHAAIMPALTPG
ncbi:hypothetical protein AB0L65_49655 [Nonomuraea sp. NPDC052116]|uniref:hypothetical protein n=1 Tax=Nonomuraea sp. NPDC052116 TaxID=3155665 RepID=UPI003438A994